MGLPVADHDGWLHGALRGVEAATAHQGLAARADLPQQRRRAPHGQGLTFVHFSAQRKRFLWARGCIRGLFGGCLRGARVSTLGGV